METSRTNRFAKLLACEGEARRKSLLRAMVRATSGTDVRAPTAPADESGAADDGRIYRL